MNCDINEELSLAVIKGEFVNVFNILSSGADVNAVIEKDHNTLLHLVSTPEVTKILLSHGAAVNALNIDGETALHSAIAKNKSLSIVDVLLKHGANINIKNNFGQTPLHCAITDKEGLNMVRKLLKHGANVNATDNKGNTVLFLVVKYYKNLEVIKVLLEFDADINVRSSSLNRFLTPIDVAIQNGDLSCAQLLIKITVVKSYHKDYRKITDLRSYIKFTNSSKLSCFLDECVSEISHMKIDKVNNVSSLYEYVVKVGDDVKPLYLSFEKFDRSIFKKYFIYIDIILARLRLCLQRAHLLDKLKNFQLSSDLAFITVGSDSRQVLLNGDCLFKIGELLTNEDLLNFFMVIDQSLNPSMYSLDRYL